MRAAPRPVGGEKGQVLVLIAAAMGLVMLGATALAVDWGNGLLQKRRLQNTADAAVLAAGFELQRGSSPATAASAAQSIVSSNTGGAVALPYPGNGSGGGLSDGIEIGANGDIRAAVVRQVNTYFAPILGVNSLTVRARSRGSVGPYGVLPIAVKRFSAGDASSQLGTNGNPATVRDYMAPASSDIISTWPSPLTAPASPPAGYTSPDGYDPAVSGSVMPLIGQNALANVANGNDFHFFVAPDVRGITQPTPIFYNGITSSTSVQLLKDIESGYFLAKGYPGPNPVVGEQIGALNGTNTSLTVDAMRKVYRRGDVITAMVYDGTVYRKPMFDLRLDAAIKSSSNIGPTGSPLTFQVTLVPRNNFNSGGVEFSATGLGSWGDWRFASGAYNTTYATPVAGTSITVPFSISSENDVEGAKTALIRGYDPFSGNMRTASATVVVGDDQAFSISCTQAYQVVEQGSATRFDLDLQGWHGYSTRDVTIDPVEWFTSGPNPSPTSAPPGVTLTLPSSVRVRDGQVSGLRVNVDVAAGAGTGEWMFRVRARDGDSNRDQEMFLTLQVLLSGTGPTAGNTTSFIQMLGYANFVITYANNSSTPSPSVDNNTIYAYAVSPLVASPDLLGRGLSPRLMGWNQAR